MNFQGGAEEGFSGGCRLTNRFGLAKIKKGKAAGKKAAEEENVWIGTASGLR
jgi:hypothetical protein